MFDFTHLVQLIHAIYIYMHTPFLCATSRRRIYIVRSLFVHLSILACRTGDIEHILRHFVQCAMECNGLMHLPCKRRQKTLQIEIDAVTQLWQSSIRLCGLANVHYKNSESQEQSSTDMQNPVSTQFVAKRTT